MAEFFEQRVHGSSNNSEKLERNRQSIAAVESIRPTWVAQGRHSAAMLI
jgi:hypothetical protein